jgi:dynein heavy chain 1
MKKFTNMAREMMRKRQERFISIKVVLVYVKFQERTLYLKDWWKQLAVMTGPTNRVGKEVGGMDMEEVKEVYEISK